MATVEQKLLEPIPKDDPRRQRWSTPDDFFKAATAEFAFDVDVCATADNTKCKDFITPYEDALCHSTIWIQREMGRYVGGGQFTTAAWCNPGFEKPGPWVQKAFGEVCDAPNAVVCVLGLGSLASEWFGFCAENCAEIRDLSPRVQFVPHPDIQAYNEQEGIKSSNPRDCCLFVFRTPPYSGKRPCNRWTWNWKNGTKEG